MLHQTNQGDLPCDPEDAVDQALLGLLVHGNPGLWSLTELSRSLTPSADGTAGAHDTADAVERLYAAGLIHRVGQFVFATRAAHAAQRLVG